MINVVIADDHPIVRAGLKQIITEEADISVVGEASNGIELLNLVRHHDYDVVLLDLSMPGMRRAGRAQTAEDRKTPPAGGYPHHPPGIPVRPENHQGRLRPAI